jgi:hydrogenase nickel incorporation protein HypA/HybF
MHEAGIAQQVIEACEVHLSRHGAARATRVGLKVGALASIDPEALRFCFDSLKAGTPLATATLMIEWRSRFGCECAQAAVDLAAVPGICPTCGAAESFADACALDIRYLEFEGATDVSTHAS